MKRLVTFLISTLLSTTSFAQDFTAQTTKGRTLTFKFHTVGSDTVNMDTNAVTVCVSDSSVSVSKLGLWMKMPNHEHGSSPTTVHPAKNGCSLVQELNFTMSGKWQIHVRLSDGDSTGKAPLEVMVAEEGSML